MLLCVGTIRVSIESRPAALASGPLKGHSCLCGPRSKKRCRARVNQQRIVRRDLADGWFDVGFEVAHPSVVTAFAYTPNLDLAAVPVLGFCLFPNKCCLRSTHRLWVNELEQPERPCMLYGRGSLSAEDAKVMHGDWGTQ